MDKKKINVDQLLRTQEQKSVDEIIVKFLVVMLAVIPLLTRATTFEFASPVISGSSLDGGIKADVFTYYKFTGLLIGVVLVSMIFLYKMIGKGYEIKRSYINASVLVMFLFVLLSGVFAEYKTLGMFGQYNRHEGTLTYLGYLILFFISANILYTEKQANSLTYALYPLILVNAFLGLAYFYGYDVLKNAFFRGILLPAELSQSSLNAGASFNSTINNPNYASGIAGVMVVLFLTKASLDTNIKTKMISALFSVIAFAMLLSSLSTSGFVTFVVLLPFIIVLILLSRSRKAGLLTVAGALAAFTLVFFAMNSHNPRVWDESVGFFLGTSKTGMQSKINTEELDGWKKFAERHSPFQANIASAAGEAPQQNDEFNLPPQSWSAGTGRTYIWSKTLELVKERPLLGYGLDTLAYFFPQDDPGKNSGLNDPNTIVDKPHNMYVGIGFGAGAVALLAFAWLIVRHLWRHILLFRKGIENNRHVILASLFAAWCAYLIQALFNDSIIGTAPIFWILFGVSVSLLRQGEVAE